MAIIVTERPFERVFAGNTIHYELYSATAVADTSVYFEVQVFFKNSNGADFASIATQQYDPFGGYATVEISAILDSLLEFAVPPITADPQAVYQAPQQSGFFYIAFREVTPLDTNPQWDGSESDFIRFVIKGGLDILQYRGNNFWVNYWQVEKPFLTWQRNGRLASLEERMFLAFLFPEDITPLLLRISVMYTDGTGTQLDTTLTGTANIVTYFPAGAAQWNLETLNQQKEIFYWQLQLFDVQNGGELLVPLSEAFRYERDNRHDDNNTTLHYRGSLGSFDSIRIRGVIEKKLGYNGTEQQRAVKPDYYDGHYLIPQRVVAGNREKLAWKGDIGHMRKEDQDRLRDAQVIREVWQEKEGKWWPIIITTPDFTLNRSDDSRFHMPVEWELAHNGSPYYTPGSINLGSGVFTSNVCRAYLSDITLVHLEGTAQAPGFKIATLAFTENDPQAASEVLRYRSYTDSAQYPWVEHTYTPIEVLVKDEVLTTVELQAICANGVLGKKVTYQIDTRTPVDPGGGEGEEPGGEEPSPEYEARQLFNNTAQGTGFAIFIDGSYHSSGSVGAGETVTFYAPDLAGQELSIRMNFIATEVYMTGDQTIHASVNEREATFTNVTSSNYSIVLYYNGG